MEPPGELKVGASVQRYRAGVRRDRGGRRNGAPPCEGPSERAYSRAVLLDTADDVNTITMHTHITLAARAAAVGRHLAEAGSPDC
jgi:hypothetical protein